MRVDERQIIHEPHDAMDGDLNTARRPEMIPEKGPRVITTSQCGFRFCTTSIDGH